MTTTTPRTTPPASPFLMTEVTAEQSTNVTLLLHGFRKDVTIEHLRELIDAMRRTADQWTELADRIEAARPQPSPTPLPEPSG